MGLKNIDMQLAVSRMTDTGKMQSELNDRAQLISNQNHQLEQKESKLRRKTINKKEESEKAKWQNKQSASDNYEPILKVKEENRDADNNPSHPYKGKMIDYSG